MLLPRQDKGELPPGYQQVDTDLNKLCKYIKQSHEWGTKHAHDSFLVFTLFFIAITYIPITTVFIILTITIIQHRSFAQWCARRITIDGDTQEYATGLWASLLNQQKKNGLLPIHVFS